MDEIDLLEQSPIQISHAKKNVPFVRKFYELGFQDWQPTCKYTVVWAQFFLMYLTDADLVSLLKKSGDSLNKGGLIFVKENVFDDDDMGGF